MRNILKLLKKKKLFYFQAKKKAQKNFELKSKNIYIYIYICNRASPQKIPTSILNVKQTQFKQKNETGKANPQILKKKKKKPKPYIHCKSLNQKPQATKSDITKANLKTKTSTE